MRARPEDSNPLPRIPVPFSARWREFRTRLLPPCIMLIVIGAIVPLWKEAAVNTGISGIGEGVRSLVSSPRRGVLQQVLVRPYQTVQAGQPLAVLMPIDPMAQIDLVQTELEIARLRLMPTLAEDNAVDYQRLRMDLFRTKSELAMAEVNVRRAESDVRRSKPLYEQKLLSEDLYELAMSTRDLYRAEIEQKSNTVAELELQLKNLQSFQLPEFHSTNDLKFRLAEKLENTYRQAITNWDAVVLRAPIAGMVTVIYRQEGENIAEDEALVGINAYWSDRIVAYLRQPLPMRPAVGTPVLITTRNRERLQYQSEIAEIGAQFEIITNALAFVKEGALVDSGLPFTISLPPGLKLRPGEVVDLAIRQNQAGTTAIASKAN
jgi:multidrug resistance efflux pump